jgi:hypothetical protein
MVTFHVTVASAPAARVETAGLSRMKSFGGLLFKKVLLEI